MKSLKVIEAMFCDSIKRALQRREEEENGEEEAHENGENNTLTLMRGNISAVII